LQLKVSDLGLSANEKERLSRNDAKDASIALVKSKYLDAVPATFLEPLAVESRSMGNKGDVTKGKFIYERSCMHCHKKDGVTKTVFGNEKGMKDFSWLVSYLPKNNGGSIYLHLPQGHTTKRAYPAIHAHLFQRKIDRRTN
jgi:mono/diheme cytochrome c family protein